MGGTAPSPAARGSPSSALSSTIRRRKLCPSQDFFSVSGDTWMPAFLSPNEWGSYPSYKTAWNKAQLPPDSQSSFKIRSQPSYSWQSEPSKLMPYTPPKHFPAWRQQSSASIRNTRLDSLVTLTTVLTLLLSQAATTAVLEKWPGETLPADAWKAIWNARFPAADTHAIHSHKTSAMSSQFYTRQGGNVGRYRKPQRQTWSEGGVNHEQLFLQ